MAADADEIAALKNSDLSASIVLGFNPMEPGVEGKLNMWENGGSVLDKGLLETAEECGIDKPFMDVAITPLGQGAGAASKNILCS